MIFLDDTHYITNNSIYGYVLREVVGTTKKGEERYKVLGYFGTVQACIRFYSKKLKLDYLQGIKEKDERITVKYAINEFDKIDKRIEGIVKH